MTNSQLKATLHNYASYAVTAGVAVLPLLDLLLSNSDKLPPWVDHGVLSALGAVALVLHHYSGSKTK